MHEISQYEVKDMPHFSLKRIKLPEPASTSKYSVSLKKPFAKDANKVLPRPGLVFFTKQKVLEIALDPERINDEFTPPHVLRHYGSTTAVLDEDSCLMQISQGSVSKSCASFVHPDSDSQRFFGNLDIDDVKSNQASLQDLCDYIKEHQDSGFMVEINDGPDW